MAISTGASTCFSDAVRSVSPQSYVDQAEKHVGEDMLEPQTLHLSAGRRTQELRQHMLQECPPPECTQRSPQSRRQLETEYDG